MLSNQIYAILPYIRCTFLNCCQVVKEKSVPKHHCSRYSPNKNSVLNCKTLLNFILVSMSSFRTLFGCFPIIYKYRTVYTIPS